MIMVFKFLGQDLYLKKDLYGNFFSIVRFIYVKMGFFFFFIYVLNFVLMEIYIFLVLMYFFLMRDGLVQLLSQFIFYSFKRVKQLNKYWWWLLMFELR